MACAALLLDIGNTTVCGALGAGQRIFRVRRISTASASPGVVASFLDEIVGGHEATSAVLSSVVPAVTGRWTRALRTRCGHPPLVVDHRVELGVAIDYPKPATIGADRLANASAAISRFGAPVVVADFGTALTFDVVSSAGEYVGGIITPGISLMTDYLAEKTALVPHVQLAAARHAVGKSTAEAVCIGARVGYQGIVREIVHHLREHLHSPNVPFVATGGNAEWIVQGMGIEIPVDPHLTLRGLLRIRQLNVEPERRGSRAPCKGE